MNYKIWDKKENLIFPNGKIYTPDEVMQPENFGFARYCNAVLIGMQGQITCEIHNFDAIKDSLGIATDDNDAALKEYLAHITSKENASAEASAKAVSNEELTATSLASIAASMEYQNMLTLEDAEVE